MNLLVDKLPTDYEGLKVETNFRSFVLFELLMQDNKLDKKTKISLALNLFYKNQEIDDIKKAMDGILWFYKCGNEEKIGKGTGQNKKKLIYSFEHDADLIYSAFLDQYSVDLNEIDYLHWFKFKAMFKGLKADNKICEAMGYRAIDLNEIKDENERKRIQKIQREWALPDERTEEEKESDFANALW